MSEMPNDLRAKILIAEDDAIVALDLQGMVMRLGYDVVAIVDSGSAAIAAARRFLPDIILLDMALNGPLDGIEVAREIHTTFDVPVVFCVSSPDLSILVRAKEISYAGYLLKPINPDSLATTLDTVLYKYKLEKRVQRAEERFRKIAEKLEIASFFLDQGASFAWEWTADAGARLSCPEECQGLSMPDAGNRLEAIVLSRFSGIFSQSRENLGASPSVDAESAGSGLLGDETTPKIASLLSVPDQAGNIRDFAVIGVWNSERKSVSGMLIPLKANPS